MAYSHVLFVCTTCASNTQSTLKNHPSGGEQLLEKLRSLHQQSPLQDHVSIQAVRCMGVCDRDCAIAFAAPGKRTYLFGCLPVNEPQLEATATAVLDCASQYYAKPDGALAYADRPELLKTRVIARIPPIPGDKAAIPSAVPTGSH